MRFSHATRTCAIATLFLLGLAGRAEAATFTGGKVGNYKILMLDAPYEPVSDGAKYFSSMSPKMPDIGWYYYNGYANLTLPEEFTFRYFGKDFTKIGVQGNGFITSGTPSYIYDNQPTPSAAAPTGVLALWWENFGGTSWDDYQPGVRWEIVGTGKEQILKIEWHNVYNYLCYEYNNQYGGTYPECESAKHYTFSAWIYTAEDDVHDSLIQFHYGKVTNPDGIESPYPYGAALTATMGIEAPDQVTGAMFFDCKNNCKSTDFPENKIVQFGQGSDLTSSIKSTALRGWAGVPFSAQVTVTNGGIADALGFGVKLFASPDTKWDAGDVEMAKLPLDLDDPSPDDNGLYSLGQDETITVDFTGPLPRDLEEGARYYVLGYADPPSDTKPGGRVREDLDSNNTSVYGPIEIGAPTPDVAVSDIMVDKLSVAPGATLQVDWTATNLGNLPVDGITYWVVLSVEDVITPSDTVIGQGVFSIDELDSIPISETFTVNNKTRPGVYRLGVIIDPDNSTPEIDDFNNVAILADSVLVGADGVTIASGDAPNTLPEAYVGSPYCEHLVAAGGNGTYVWSATDPTKLPAGLTLREEPADARAKGKPFDTLLCGVPSLRGSFTFEVQVSSGGKSAKKSLSLSVSGDVAPLTIITSELPAATFQVSYEASLLATGGVPPYEWQLLEGSTPLPFGVDLGKDGRLLGMPGIDGRYPFKVQVRDTAGTVDTTDLYLSITPPGRLTCVSQALGVTPVGQEFVGQLLAAGGNKPYLWSTVESRRLAEGVTDPGETIPDLAPPGLVLAESGSISGTPSASGSYLWTAKVTDQAAQTDVCVVSMEFASGALGITTSAVPVVCTGDEYSVQLEATGGDGGFLTWTLDSNSEVPEGLELTPEGLVTGNVSDEVLEGNTSKTFNVTVHVRDSSNAKGLGAVALLVQHCIATEPPVRRSVEKTGCGSNAGSGVPALLGLAALALLRRRRS